MRFNNWSPGVPVLAFVDQIQIFSQGRADRRHVLLLLTRGVKAAFGIQRVDLLVALENLNDGEIAAVIRILLLRVRAAKQRVGTKRQLVSKPHLFFFTVIKWRSQDSDEDQRDTEVDDVASVAASVAMPQANHRRRQVLAGVARDHASASNEL